MNKSRQLTFLRAQLGTIQKLISNAERASDLMSASQFYEKREAVEREIAELEQKDHYEASVSLFFGGRPVTKSIGINASFASKAVGDFQNIVSRLFAFREIGDLGKRGPVALSPVSNLMITDVVRGSFGFVLEENFDQSSLTKTPLADIVDEASSLIHGLTDEDEKQFFDSLEQVDDRVLGSLKSFFSNLDQELATLRVVSGENEFTFDEGAIHRAAVRINNVDTTEKDEKLEGYLIGLLPEHRKFEFKLDDGEVIFGSVEKGIIENHAELASQGLIGMQVRVSAKVFVRKVVSSTGAEKYIYRLLSVQAL